MSPSSMTGTLSFWLLVVCELKFTCMYVVHWMFFLYIQFSGIVFVNQSCCHLLLHANSTEAVYFTWFDNLKAKGSVGTHHILVYNNLTFLWSNCLVCFELMKEVCVSQALR